MEDKMKRKCVLKTVLLTLLAVVLMIPAWAMAADYNVANATQLMAALTSIRSNAGTTMNINITASFQLSDADWATWTEAQNTFVGGTLVINGNGNTIQGLKKPLVSYVGGGSGSITICNLNVTGSAIEHDGAGCAAFVGFVDSPFSGSILLENCSVMSSSINGTGMYPPPSTDPLTHTGGLVGYSGLNGCLTIKDCAVSDTQITGVGSAGGIIGHGMASGDSALVIQNCEVLNNTITSTEDRGSKKPIVGYVMGTAGNGQSNGGATVEAIVKDNAAKQNTTSVDSIMGRIAQGGTVEITGGAYDAGTYLNDGGNLSISGGSFAVDPRQNASVPGSVQTPAGTIAQNNNPETPFHFGAEAESAIQNAPAGSTVIVEKTTNSNLTVPNGVLVQNNTGSSLVVNGNAVTSGGSYLAPFPAGGGADDVPSVPRTGDATPIAQYMALMLVTLTGMMLLRRKRA